MRECTKCRKNEDETDFYTTSLWCGQCHREGKKNWYAGLTPTQRRERKYKLPYGTLDKMYDEQDHACAICLRNVDLQIDHCHAKNHVRGLLCIRCNTGLGKFLDSPALLERAKQYLKDAGV